MAEKFVGPGSRHAGFLRIEVSENSVKGMKALQNYVDTLPNRIETAKVLAVNAAARKMRTYLKNRYGNIGLGLSVEAKVAGTTTTFTNKGRSARLEIKPGQVTKQSKVDHGYNNIWGARVAFYGRKGYTLPQQFYELRPESIVQYGQYLFGPLTIPRRNPNYKMKADINRQAKAYLIADLRRAFVNVGFGQRGGSARLKDMPHVSTKSTTPDAGGIQVRKRKR